MHLKNRRELIRGGTAFVSCCFCRGLSARAAEAPPRSFDMIAYCCLDCARCDAYLATIHGDADLRKRVAERWRMAPAQIDCLGCKSKKALFDCTLKKCASRRGLPTCAHCPDFPGCKDEQWRKYPKLRDAAQAMRVRLAWAERPL